MPWSGSGLKIECANRDINNVLKVPDDLYQRGCVTDLESALDAARRIGFPVMIKASEGVCENREGGSRE